MEDYWNIRFPSSWRSLVTDREQNAQKKEKHSYKMQETSSLIFFFLYVVAQKHEAWWMIPDILIFLWPIPEGAKVRIEKKGKNTFGFDGFPPYTK